ncbi:MAG: ABC transporter ATP-binding protein [Verrucomicrobiota bacterium]
MNQAAAPGQAAISRQRGPAEPKQRPLDSGIFVRLFGYTRPYAALRNVLAGLALTRSVQLPVLAWILGEVIGGPISNRQPDALFWGVLGFLAFSVFVEVTFYFRSRLALQLGESVVHDLRAECFAHLHRMPMSFFHRTKLGTIISRLTSDIEALRTGVQNVLFISIVQLGQGIVSAIIMCWIDWALFLIVLAMAPGLYIMTDIFRHRLSKASRDVQESFSRVTASLAEAVNGIRVTQGFAREEVNAGLFRQLIQDHSRYNINMARASALYLPILDLNTQFFTGALLVIGAYRVLSPEIAMPLEDLIQFLFLAALFFQPVQVLGQQYNVALQAMAGAERVFRFLDTKPDWEDDPAAREVKLTTGQVEFRGVNFSYDGETPVLRDLSFTAPPGTTTALVGETGSGKSTILALVSKFYLPGGGELLFDGIPVEKITTQSLHRHLGVVQQQNFLFTGSVYDNIRFGRPEATEAEVWDCLDQLGCKDLIEQLPQSLATIVGEKGTGVSLGQRQLICFARALLPDPKFILLDEATSSIDAITELRLQNAMTMLLSGRTSFVVAHRLSTIRRADQILLLSHGRLVESGDHRSLLERNGDYAKLYRQFTDAAESVKNEL